MPTVIRERGFRFFFFSNEGFEPIHIHVEKAGCYAKIWIEPFDLVYNYGFNSKELTFILKTAEQKKEIIKEKWNEFFREKN